MSRQVPPDVYPPEHHVLRDLRLYTERDVEGRVLRSGLPIVKETCGPGGPVRAGVLATLVDVAGGASAVQAVAPDWVATSELVLHVLRPLREGLVIAEPSLLRRTRATIVLEVGLSCDGVETGLATMTFAVLPSRGEDRPRSQGAIAARTDFGLSGSGLAAPLAELLGARVVDAAAGVVVVPKALYIGNSHGAVQGGVLGVIAELAAHAAGEGRLGGAVDTLDLSLNYLGQVRQGPARTSARVLRADDRAALLRVEIRDPGNEGRLCTVATVEVARV